MDKKEKAETLKPVSFRIDSVRDIDFHFINKEGLGIKDEFDEKKLNLQYRWTFKNEPGTKDICILIVVNITYPKQGEASPVVLVNYFNETKFSITNFEEVVVKGSNGKLNVPDAVLENFLMISISTIRGILLEKLAKSDYSRLILPAVTPDFIKGMLKSYKDSFSAKAK